MSLERKYVVMKAEDFDDVISALEQHQDSAFAVKVARENLLGLALDSESVFVVRQVDVFSAGGLHGYATNILSTVSTLMHTCPDALQGREDEFFGLANDVADLAYKWETGSKKLPD